MKQGNGPCHCFKPDCKDIRMPKSYDQREQGQRGGGTPDRPGPALRVLPLRFKLESRSLSLNFFSGPLWRSGFGLALKIHFPGIFALLFADQARLGRLYALQPPSRAVHPGDVFDLGLSLFGPACDHAMACTQAIAQLGDMGLGSDRGKYALMETCVAGSGTTPFFIAKSGLVAEPTPIPPQTWLEHSAGNIRELHMDLLTPLLIKKDNGLLRGPFEFSLLVRRLHGRLAQVCEAAGESSPLLREIAHKQNELAASVRLHHFELSHAKVKRQSARSQETMIIEGLTGTLCFQGNLAPFTGLLALGTVLSLGGKTAFGFGGFGIRVHQNG